MTGVKIFNLPISRTDPEPLITLEKQVNEWLKDNQHIEILDRHVTSSGGYSFSGTEIKSNCTIVIFFRR